jgi:M6 family metalloprotease-like protein
VKFRGAAAVLLVWLLLPAVARGADDRDIRRPMVLRPHPAAPAGDPGARLAPEGWPSAFVPRPFPGVLRESRLPAGPDGILWRRLKARRPGEDPRTWVTPSPAGLKHWLAEARSAREPDTVRILALRVDFEKDSGGKGSTTLDGRFDLRDSSEVLIDPPPHNRAYFASHMEALRRYYWRQSGGQLVLTWEIYPAEEDSSYHLNDTADYGPWVLSGDDTEILDLAERLVRDGFAKADSSAAPPDFRRFDSFWLIHAGADYQGDINGDTPYDIPSFNIFLADPVAVQDSTFFIDIILVVPETVSQDEFTGALNGVVTHEFGHQIGFYDLYDVLTFIPMVGMFSLMDSGEQLYGTVWDEERQKEIFVRGVIPASIDPWTKLLFFPRGVQATWITDDRTFELPAVQRGNQIALVPIGGQGLAEDAWYSPENGEDSWRPELLASEYYILENRPYDLNGDSTVVLERDDSTGVVLGPANLELAVTDSLGWPPDTLGVLEQDYLLPGEGVLIWHIDNAAIDAASSVCYGCINISTVRPGVDVEEADGIADLGDVYSVEWTGGRFEYWFQGGYTSFGPGTDPSTASGAGGSTGIQFDVADSAGLTMRVAAQRGWMRRGWPRYVALPSASEGVNPVDLDYDGVCEIVTAGGRAVFALAADGSAYPYAAYDDGLLVDPPDSLLLPGVAVQPAFVDAWGEEDRLIAVATNTSVLAFERFGDRLLEYPGGVPSPALRFTTPPLALDSVVVIGDAEGRLRGLRPWAEPELLWRTAGTGYPVTALAAGDLFGDGGLALAWGNAGGEVHAAVGSQAGGYAVAEGWGRSLAQGEEIRWLLLIEEILGEPGCLVAAGAAGTIGIFGADGGLLPGWPGRLDSPPAGPPVVGDPDGDGSLELAVTEVSGLVHLYTLAGEEEAHWPRSVWHPDLWAFGKLASGPVIADVTGDGVAEIIQGSADGVLHAFEGERGGEVSGWPLAAGFPVSSGPLIAPTGPGGRLQLVTADATGFAALLEIGLPARAIGRGEMWRSDGDPTRSHCFPRERRTDPQLLSGLWDEGSLIFTPNPIVGSAGALRVRMGTAGTLRLKLFDASGERVWEGTHSVTDVTQPVVWDLDLKDVAPGLYVARIAAEGNGASRQVLRKLAVVK